MDEETAVSLWSGGVDLTKRLQIRNTYIWKLPYFPMKHRWKNKMKSHTVREYKINNK